MPSARQRREFDRLATEVIDGLYAFALRLERDPASAEDLVQDALIRAMDRFDQLEEPRAFRAWVTRVLFRTWQNRRPARPEAWRRTFADLDRSAKLVRLPGPEASLATRRLGEDVVAALDRLPDGQRDAVWLVDALGFSFGEASDILDVPPGTVASRVARGRSALRVGLGRTAREWGVGS